MFTNNVIVTFCLDPIVNFSHDTMKDGGIRLLKNVREIKSTTGLDTIGVAIGRIRVLVMN